MLFQQVLVLGDGRRLLALTPARHPKGHVHREAAQVTGAPGGEARAATAPVPSTENQSHLWTADGLREWVPCQLCPQRPLSNTGSVLSRLPTCHRTQGKPGCSSRRHLSGADQALPRVKLAALGSLTWHVTGTTNEGASGLQIQWRLRCQQQRHSKHFSL